jgi:HK97 family phage major capsid protein
MSAEHYRPVSILPTGTGVARFIQAIAIGDQWAAEEKAAAWRDTPHIAEALRWHTKSAIAPGMTTDSTWAGPLAQFGIASEAVTLMRGMSILGSLEGKMQKVPLHVKVAVETGTGVTGGWVTQGGAIPVQATAFATSSEEFYKFGVIIPLSEELVTTSNPAAESTINRTVLGGLAKSIDGQLLDPTVTLSAGVNPASILAGSTEVVTTGSTAATIAADLAGMLAAVTTPGPLVWIMRP